MIIDDHVHVHEWSYRKGDPEYEVEYVIRQMDEAGVDRAIIEDSLAYVGASQARSNGYTKEAVDAFPDRLIGFANIKPPEGARQCVEEIDRTIGEWGFRGIKLHPMADGYAADDTDFVDPIIEAVVRHDVPVWFHTGHLPYATPMQIARLAARFPAAKLIIGHLGGAMIYDAILCAQSRPNLYLDISLQGAASVHLACAEVPADKLIFGSDAPYGDIRSSRRAVETADLSAEDKAKILGGNIAALCSL
jgi:predicted TIM-barrel fold metal-dependent hydrolase